MHRSSCSGLAPYLEPNGIYVRILQKILSVAFLVHLRALDWVRGAEEFGEGGGASVSIGVVWGDAGARRRSALHTRGNLIYFRKEYLLTYVLESS